MFDEIRRYDEDGHPLWEVIPPPPTPQQKFNTKGLDQTKQTEIQSNESLLAQLPVTEEENWDDELDESREWNVNIEDLNDQVNHVEDLGGETDDMLVQDDPMLDELIG